MLSLLALIDSLFNYFWTGNGIHGSEGALLVVVSTLLLALAAGVFLNRWDRGRDGILDRRRTSLLAVFAASSI